MSKNSILKLINLHKTYENKVRALKGVNLEFKEGEFVVIIGPSGAGKSTLLRCINRLIEPSDGAIIFNGKAVEKAKGNQLRSLRTQIGMVFQHYNLVDRSNVIKNVLHGRLGHMNIMDGLLSRYPEEYREKALILLEQVGLENQVYQRADKLSGGQKQRVGICRSLIQDPKLLLADEPIASLDPKSADVVMDALYETTRTRGLTVIVNLHQVDYALKYATRIIGLKDGEVVYDGKPEDLSKKKIKSIYEGKEDQMHLKNQVVQELEISNG